MWGSGLRGASGGARCTGERLTEEAVGVGLHLRSRWRRGMVKVGKFSKKSGAGGCGVRAEEGKTLRGD